MSEQNLMDEVVDLMDELTDLFAVKTQHQLTREEQIRVFAHYTRYEGTITLGVSILRFLQDYHQDKFAYLRSLISPHAPPQVENSSSDVFIFADNSKLCFEARETIKGPLCIDYGRLRGIIQDGRKLGDQAILVGSKPLPNDSFWKVIDDSATFTWDPEDATHPDVIIRMMTTVYMKKPAILALLVGDFDFGPSVWDALDKGWTVELWHWESANSLPNRNVIPSSSIARRLLDDPRIIKKPLNKFYKKFTYRPKPNNIRGMHVFELCGGDSQMVMDCFLAMNVLACYTQNKRNTEYFLLYFEDRKKFDAAKQWLKTKYPAVLVRQYRPTVNPGYHEIGN